MRWLVPGDITGAAALLSKPWRYLVSTEAVKDSRLLVWNRADIGRLAVRFPKLLHNAMFIAADYLEWYLTAHLALMCHSDRQRCASVLVSISRAVGQKVTGGIELRITNEELANAAGITLFAVSRFMSEWQRLGAIAKSRGKVLLRSVNMLHREARR